MKRSLVLGAFLLLVGSLACNDAGQATAPDGTTDVSTDGSGVKLGTQSKADFIVVLDDNGSPASVASQHGLSPKFTYTHVFKGFAASIPQAALAGLLRDNHVRKVLPDQAFHVDESTTTAASWGLDRVDQRTANLDGSYHYGPTGAGVTAYIVDTGIRYDHQDFGGRATFGFDSFGDGGGDCYGHGTHVAGTVGGTVYGIAKQVSLVSVRVIDCSGIGTTSSVAAGLDWVLANGHRPGVVNMSIGGDPDDVVDEAVRSLVAGGFPVVVAAGNNALDACNYSPSRVLEAMTIGATAQDDKRAVFSNYGSCVDMYAPGVSITSDYYSSDTGIAMKSGTSMASPHVAGAVALYLEQHPGASPADVAAALASTATTGVVDTGENGSHTALLVYTLGDTAPATGTLAPSASFTFSCTELSCAFTDGSTDGDGTIASWAWDFGDGSTATDQNPSHDYAAPGTYSVTLTVTDNAGATGTSTQAVDASTSTPTNASPSASFSATCSGLSCSFADGSTDPDGSLVRWAWDYGDGASSILTLASSEESHSFTAGGVYLVSLTVTDDGGATSTTSQAVKAGIVLTATGFKMRGRHQVDLSWEDAQSPRVDIYVGADIVATVDAGSGGYVYATDNRGQGTYDFRVCDAGTSYCSRIVTVSF